MSYNKVIVCSGHMIDKPDRPSERFPPRKEAAVRDRIVDRLKTWQVSTGDLGICGGARGADILFAEACADRGTEVWLFLPLPLPAFLQESVQLPDSDWEDRFFALRNRLGVKMFFQPEHPESTPNDVSVFARNNLLMIDTARGESTDPKNLYGLLVWDEKATSDGPGGTSDFAERIRQLGGNLAIINPTKL